MKALRRDIPHFTPNNGGTFDGARKKYNSNLHDGDGVPLGASSGGSAMAIDGPGNTGNRKTNPFYEEPWRLDDLQEGGGL